MTSLLWLLGKLVFWAILPLHAVWLLATAIQARVRSMESLERKHAALEQRLAAAVEQLGELGLAQDLPLESSDRRGRRLKGLIEEAGRFSDEAREHRAYGRKWRAQRALGSMNVRLLWFQQFSAKYVEQRRAGVGGRG